MKPSHRQAGRMAGTAADHSTTTQSLALPVATFSRWNAPVALPDTHRA